MSTTSPINPTSPFAKALKSYSEASTISDLKQVQKGNVNYISFKDNKDPYTLRTVDKYEAKTGNPILSKSYLADGSTATLFPDGRLVQRSAAGKTSTFNMSC